MIFAGSRKYHVIKTMLTKIASDATIRTMVARSVMSAILLLRRETRFHRVADGVHNARISAGRQLDHTASHLSNHERGCALLATIFVLRRFYRHD
jgi:hypothetical protein